MKNIVCVCDVCWRKNTSRAELTANKRRQTQKKHTNKDNHKQFPFSLHPFRLRVNIVIYCTVNHNSAYVGFASSQL